MPSYCWLQLIKLEMFCGSSCPEGPYTYLYIRPIFDRVMTRSYIIAAVIRRPYSCSVENKHREITDATQKKILWNSCFDRKSPSVIAVWQRNTQWKISKIHQDNWTSFYQNATTTEHHDNKSTKDLTLSNIPVAHLDEQVATHPLARPATHLLDLQTTPDEPWAPPVSIKSWHWTLSALPPRRS